MTKYTIHLVDNKQFVIRILADDGKGHFAGYAGCYR